MIPILVNEIIYNRLEKETYRILWTDNKNDVAYLIDIYEDLALPFIEKISDIRENIVQGDYQKLKIDMLAKQILTKELSEKEIELRDKAWNIISDIVFQEPNIFMKDKRGTLIKKTLTKHKTSYNTVNKYLRKYWQRGKSKNGVIPDFFKCDVSKNMTSDKLSKLGRKNRDGLKRKNVDDETKEIFMNAYKKYYLKPKKSDLTYAYKMMIKEKYAQDVYYDEDGVEHVVIADDLETPSERQFRYWYKKLILLDDETKSRVGEKAFERNSRPVLGSSTFGVLGPGSKYQIDATPGNVYLLSRYNEEWGIGRPIIYFVVDVFSRMIVGVHIGVEGPSWLGMMMALYNTASDKKAYCKKYGITIAEEDWSSRGLPEVLVGDRGELEGVNVNHAIEGLNMSVELNPAYRPDWKGIVEKLLDKSQKQIKPFLPGYVDTTYRERGEKDYREEAALTIDEYTKIIIQFILHHNKNLYMRNYVRDEDMIQDNVEPKPVELWNWGIRNRTGRPKVYDKDIVKFYLLPTETARVTEEGIKYRKMFYSCDKAMKERWFSKARQKGTWKVKFSYDPRNMDQIYIHQDDPKNPFEVCHLLEHQERYRDRTFEEITQLLNYENNEFNNSKMKLLQKDIHFMENVESIVKKAHQDREKAGVSQSESKDNKTKNIRKNRKVERVLIREEEQFKLGVNDGDSTNDKETTADNSPIQLNKNDPSVKDLFMKRRLKNHGK